MNAPVQPTIQIAQLVCLLGRIEGRKKMQKLVHILQELGYPFAERFDYSFYGMYSTQLRGELDALETEKLIVQEQGPTAFGDVAYTFKSTPELQRLLNEIGVESQPAWREVARRLNGFSAQILEGISTVLFLRRRGLKGEELKGRLLALKPHLEKIYPDCEKHLKALHASAAI
jgi:uncharacterized protein YwgA